MYVGGSMESFSCEVPDERDIDRIYAGEEVMAGRGRVFRPFRQVDLTLTFTKYTRGRSATIFWWEDEEGRSYPMFCMEVERLLNEDMLRKTISGKWSAEKRGANYGIRLVG